MPCILDMKSFQMFHEKVSGNRINVLQLMHAYQFIIWELLISSPWPKRKNLMNGKIIMSQWANIKDYFFEEF